MNRRGQFDFHVLKIRIAGNRLNGFADSRVEQPMRLFHLDLGTHVLPMPNANGDGPHQDRGNRSQTDQNHHEYGAIPAGNLSSEFVLFLAQVHLV